MKNPVRIFDGCIYEKELIIKWCNNNQNACKWIIQNANFYMRQFSNPMLENSIERELINSYFKCVHS